MNRQRLLCVGAVILGGIAGCVSSLQANRFAVPGDKGTPAQVRQAMAIQGVAIAELDEAAGIVYTTWESDGTNNDGTMWVYRYIVTVANATSVSVQVSVSMDLRTCDAHLGVNPHTGTVDASSCQRLPPGVTPRYYQRRLDTFAGNLSAALGGV